MRTSTALDLPEIHWRALRHPVMSAVGCEDMEDVSIMENHQFTYLSIAHSAAGAGVVGIRLRRQEGTEFVALLCVEDARRLLEDLPQQVRIASQDPN